MTGLGNTIKNSDGQVFRNGRARALEQMPPELLKKHLNTYKQNLTGHRTT